MEDLIFCILVTLASFSPVIALYVSHITGEDLNDKLQCDKCKVISRKGIWDLYNSGLENESYYKKVCPVCEKLSEFEEVYDNSPLSPRLSLVKCYKLTKTINNNDKLRQADKQLESYLKVQEMKLESMKSKTLHKTVLK